MGLDQRENKKAWREWRRAWTEFCHRKIVFDHLVPKMEILTSREPVLLF